MPSDKSGFLNEDTESESLISVGRSFQSLGALTTKTLSPLVLNMYTGRDKRPLPEDLVQRFTKS